MKVNPIGESFFSLLGLCQKAGKVVSGSVLCEKNIRSGKARLVIISSEASEATIKNFSSLSHACQVPVIIAGTREQLGRAIGKYNRTVLVILDRSFKDMLLKEQNEIQHGGDENGKNQSV